MPFPWKKVKSTKISHWVNDHLHHSQRRRDSSSLVVETGFPTSLIDLFMKNREKLKKPSKKKHEKIPSTPPPDFNYRETVGSATPSPLSSPLRSPSPFPSESPKESVVLEAPVKKKHDVEKGVDANGVLLGVLKIFIVALLALGTKRLTVGITMSAFLLFSLEYVGRNISGLLQHPSEAKGMLKLKVQRICMLLRLKEDKMDEKKGCDVMPEVRGDEVLKSRCPCAAPVDEFQSVGPEGLVYPVDGICYQKEIMVDNSCEGTWDFREIESNEVVMEKEEEPLCGVGDLKGRKSRRQKLKAKIKKIVPKKLKSRKEESNLERRFDNIGEEDFSLHAEKDVDGIRDDSESKSLSRSSSSISSGRSKNDDGISEICSLGAVSEYNEETSAKMEERGEATTGLTWRHLIHCVIILVGLIGGRGFALLLTLSWFLLMKFGGTLPRFERVPVFRSLFNSNSG